MNAVVQISANAAFSAHQLKLIRTTVAADCNASEFDLFVTVARNAGLDPFRKQISALVFNKGKADKRRMAIVTTIDGLRVIAARSNRYRPDEDEPDFTFDPELKGETNPLGLVKARVRIHIADPQHGGAWKPVTGVAYWDEFAPISDEWAEGDDGRRRPTGKKTLDRSGNWARMPRLMLAKCAEAQALRKAFPEDLSALYEAAEMDQAQVIDLTPSEMVGQAMTEDRLTKIGGAGGILFQLFPNAPLESVPLGQLGDRIMETITEFSTIEQMRWFESANTQPLREYWARLPAEALEVKKSIEARRDALEKLAAQAAKDEPEIEAAG